MNLLCQILRVAKLSVVDFFKEMPQFFLKVGSILSNHHGADWENRHEANELQANFVHLSVLSKSNVEASCICPYYVDASHKEVELDERMFVNEDDSLLRAGSLSGGTIEYMWFQGKG
ncbi:hypothetical protein NE237_006826 [Protea cynaroides]|uniref:Retinoblastoma-associated protein N-terminal domain-containing protein n=1 Tax=Protea cynaroides TaxID=273540 RepID=A0A9Q0KN90_9MAGN|nr:hypothetical protein NE237_006826 [Protea cynaroides]